jgi:Tfp pilus assembly protein FimV
MSADLQTQVHDLQARCAKLERELAAVTQERDEARSHANALGEQNNALSMECWDAKKAQTETAAYAGGLEAFVVAARRVAGYLTAKEPIDYIRDGEAWNARARFLQLLKQAEDARAALAAKPVAEPRQIGTSGKGESAEGTEK